MPQKPVAHPHLAFAQRHSKSTLSTLNAFAALSRLDNLLRDLEELHAAIKAYEAAGSSKGRRLFWFEIISYYPVGFVTCLEWHARSRLVDLFTYVPSAVRAEDLKGQINDKLLVQSVAENVTVPQLMGAMTTVGSSEKYISIFDRLFVDLKIDSNIRSIINPIILKKRNDSATFDALQHIFEYRNSIVHEIDYSTIGPWLVRSSIDVDEARDMGIIVRDVMRAIEINLTHLAPKEFPNRLDSSFQPEDELELLDRQILNLENEIASAICTYRADTGRDANADDWLLTLAAARASQQSELDFVSNADFMHNRHADFKRPVKIEIRRQRLAYLKRLRTEV